jgi:hypothetical protein
MFYIRKPFSLIVIISFLLIIASRQAWSFDFDAFERQKKYAKMKMTIKHTGSNSLITLRKEIRRTLF